MRNVGTGALGWILLILIGVPLTLVSTVAPFLVAYLAVRWYVENPSVTGGVVAWSIVVALALKALLALAGFFIKPLITRKVLRPLLGRPPGDDTKTGET